MKPIERNTRLKLSDTLTRGVVDFETLDAQIDGEVTLYSCGPTVYNHVHIGNLRTFIMDDILRRTLAVAGYDVKAVMNITDVDDKTIATSQAEHPDLGPMEALTESTRAYEQIFLNDLAAVGVDTGRVRMVRATDADSMDAMRHMIDKIYANGFAYIAEGSVYFDLAKYQAAGNTYGRLTKVDFSPQARVDNDEYDKQEARDFVLWKGQKDGEPFWDYALDGHDLPGRPGWHIECSAMALANLGQPITVHSGGIDLKFPHHENEIAQTVGATGKDFVHVFTHHNHLFVDGRKMSKSLNNFYTLEDIKAKGYHPLAFRLLCLQAQHTSELNFTWESLEAAQNALISLYGWADLVHQYKSAARMGETGFDAALVNDLGTPEALAILADVIGQKTPSTDLLAELDARLGLGLSNRPDIDAAAKQLIADREVARAAKDWDLADEIRAELAKLNLEVDDTPDGPHWRRTSL